MKLRRVTVDDVFNDPYFKKLWDEYGKESANPDLKQSSPDLSMYHSLENQKRLFGSGMFSDDGELIGVVSIVLTRIPHFDAQLASVETIWARKDKRAFGVGLRLLNEAKRLAKEFGAVGLYIGARTGSRFEKLLSLVSEPMNSVFWMKL